MSLPRPDLPAKAPPKPAAVHCSTCDAVCCRLLVVILPGDEIPAHLLAVSEHGLEVMARGEDGWCVANDPATHRCSIYETRPQLCRKFAMAGPYCREVRSEYEAARAIPLLLT